MKTLILAGLVQSLRDMAIVRLFYAEVLNVAAMEIEQLRAKIADDTVRIDWLEVNNISIERSYFDEDEHGDPWCVVRWDEEGEPYFGDTLREAIDKAMAGAKV